MTHKTPAQTNKGFSLLEIMVVVAIIGVIASFALPTYLDYVNRGKVAEAMLLLGGLKNPMIDYYSDRGYWPPSVTSVGGKTGGKYVTDVTTDGTEPVFYVETTMLGDATSPIGGKQLRMYYNTDTMDWRCSTDGAANPLSIKFLPAPCRD